MKFTAAISLLMFVLPFGSFCVNAATFPPLSYVDEDTEDTGLIVFLTDDEVAEIQEDFSNGITTEIETDVNFYKSKDDSADLSTIKYIELSDPNTIKEWSGEGDDAELIIEFGENYNLAPNELMCSDITSKCNPFIDGTTNIALIEVRFHPRSGLAHKGEYWRSKYTLTGTYYNIVTPSAESTLPACANAASFPSLSYVDEAKIDTGVIVFLTDDEVAKIQKNFKNGIATEIATDVNLYKSKNNSDDLSTIKYIELSDPGTIKVWNGQGYEADLDIEFGNNYNLASTELTCSDNGGQCSPFIDGTNNIALIEVRFHPRSGWAYSNQYWRNKYTLTGTYYCIVTGSMNDKRT